MAKREHRRSRYVRVSDTMLDEAWDNDLLATFTRLLCYLRQRWAREKLEPRDGCKAAISSYDLMRITGKGRADVALALLRRLADVASISVERLADVTLIDWPNVADFQDWAEAKSRLRKGGPAHGSRRTSHDAEKEEKNTLEDSGERLAPLDPSILVRLLSKEPGEEATKLAWLTSELPMIELKAAEDHPGDPKRRMAGVRARVLSHYRQHHKDPDGDHGPLTAERILKLVNPRYMR